jgi:hypothetical protein
MDKITLDKNDMNRLVVILYALAYGSGNRPVIEKVDEFLDDLRKKNP